MRRSVTCPREEDQENGVRTYSTDTPESHPGARDEKQQSSDSGITVLPL